MTRINRILFSLIGLNLLLKIYLALRPLSSIDGVAIPDDAYLSLTIARNIAKGLGPLYGHDFTNGFQPLYVFLIAPIYRLLPTDLFTPVHLALIVLTLFDTATLYILFRLIVSQSRTNAAPILIALAWIFNPYIMRTTANGLETAVSLFFIVLTYYFFVRFKNEILQGSNLVILFVFGIVLGLAMLTRIDNAILFAVFVIAICYIGIKEKRPFRRTATIILAIGLGALFACLPWIIYSYHYTGDLFPESGRAIRFLSLSTVDLKPTLSNMYMPSLIHGAGTFVKHNMAFNILLFLLSAGLLVTSLRKKAGDIFAQLRKHNIILAFLVVLILVYIFYIFGSWYFKRYLYPSVLLLLLYLSVMLDFYNAAIFKRIHKIIFNLVIALFLIISCLVNPIFNQLFISGGTNEDGYMNLGLWAKKSFPDSTVIGSCQTGALAYFADNLKVVNLDGVVSRRSFESLQEKRAIEYIKSEGIEYYIDWPINHEFIVRKSQNIKPGDLTFLYQITEFTSWHHEWYVYKVNQGE
jgi:hypothetical protein